MLVAAVPLGLIIGLTLGALGGGGSLLTVPALVHLLGLDPGVAVFSSLLIVGISSIFALVPHARAGRVRFAQGVTFGVLGTLGSFIGSALSSKVDPDVLMVAFALLMLLVSGLMLRSSRRSSGSSSGEAGGVDPDPMLTLWPLRCDCPRVLKVLVAATIVGLLTGFFGVGGGFILVPALVLALGHSMPVAVGTSLLVIAINSATALLARLGPGSGGSALEIDWSLVGVFTVATVVGSLLGGRVASRAKPRQLTLGFAALIVAIGLYTLVSALISLL